MGTERNHDVARRFNERRETVENWYPPMPEALNNKGRFEQGSPRSCMEAFASSSVQFAICTSSPGQNWKIEPWEGANTSRIVGLDGQSCLKALPDNSVTLERCLPGVPGMGNDTLWQVTGQPDDTLKIKRYGQDLCLGSMRNLMPSPELLPCNDDNHQRWMRRAIAK
ncbi:hypothetical protein D3C76_1293360 [compost metagenome]